MKKDFDYSIVPYNFTHCLHRECPRSADCMRYQVTLYAPPEKTHFPVVNPAHITGREATCPYFKPDRLTRFALGFTNLFENLPHKKAIELRKALCCHFQRSTYYRLRNKERLITPEEQEYIRQLFRFKGIKEDPVFDEYIEKYDW